MALAVCCYAYFPRVVTHSIDTAHMRADEPLRRQYYRPIVPYACGFRVLARCVTCSRVGSIHRHHVAINGKRHSAFTCRLFTLRHRQRGRRPAA